MRFCFNPRPSACDGRSEHDLLLDLLWVVSILARPHVTGAPAARSFLTAMMSVSILARPHVTGAPVLLPALARTPRMFQSSPVRM